MSGAIRWKHFANAISQGKLIRCIQHTFAGVRFDKTARPDNL
jgi:hypothetical protein